jgi:hypothetical protein
MQGLDLPGATLELMIGPVIAVPAPAFITEALESVTVTHPETGPCGFQLTFNADRTSAFTPDYALLLDHALMVGMRVVIVIILSNGVPNVISDGFITHVQMAHSKVFGAATISVTGEDVGVMMDRIDEAAQFPGLGDMTIVEALLAKYVVLGVIPIVFPTPISVVSNPLERVPVQNGTDRAYINTLAGRHGYTFMIRPGPVPLANTAYWGPPPRVGLPQATLCVDMGSATNVNSINFEYDGLAATRFVGVDQDADTEVDVPIVTVEALRIPLALEPAIIFGGPMVKTSLFNNPGDTAVDSQAYAQGMTDRSTDNVVTVTGDVDTMTYGSLIAAPGLIALRGAGLSFDGFYFVKTVTHTIKRGEYKQQFTLSREGLMPLSPVVPP